MNLIKNTLKKWGQHNTVLLSAALSYRSLLAFPSLILFALYVAKLFLQDETRRQEMLNLIQANVPDQSADLITQFGEQSLEITSWWTGLITLLILLWSGSHMVNTLELSLNTIFEVGLDPKKNSPWIWLRHKGFSFLLILIFALLLLTLIIFTAFFSSVFDSALLLYILQSGASVVILSFLFLFMLKWILYAEILWKKAWLSSLILALGTGLGVTLISIVFNQFDFASDFAVGASIVLFLIWINFMASLVFLMLEGIHLWLKKEGELKLKSYARRINSRHVTVELSGLAKWQGVWSTLSLQLRLFRWFKKRKGKS